MKRIAVLTSGGDAPGAFDRLLVTRLGLGAVKHLAVGEAGVLIGLKNNEIAATPLSEVVKGDKPLDPRLLEMARIMAR